MSKVREAAVTRRLWLGFGLIVLAVLAGSGSAAFGGGNAGPRPVTLVTSKGVVRGFGQDSPWIVWAETGVPCTRQVQTRRASGGPARSLLAKRGVSCSKRYRTNAFEQRVALGGTRALWAVETADETYRARVSVRTLSPAHPVDAELADLEILKTPTKGGYLPADAVPYAGDGSTLLYADKYSQFGFGQMNRVGADGRATPIPRTVGTRALSASRSRYAAARTIARRGARDWGPVWSPDGRRVLFGRGEGPDIGWAGNYAMSIVDVDGTHRRTLTSVENATAAWSPDGKQLLMVDDVGGRLGIVTVDLDTGARHVISRGRVRPHEPAWSPDGRHVAYVLEGGLYVAAPDGSSAHRVAPASVGMFVWSPDSSRIAWTDWGSHPGLDVTVADGSRTQRLHAGLTVYAVWSPHGDRIAWRDHISSGGDCYDASPDGSQVRKLPGDSITGCEDVAWSPDGTELAFTTIDAMSLIRPDGSGLRTLLQGGDGDVVDRVSWSADGSRLAVTIRSDNPDRIVILARSGAVTAHLDVASSPAWAPDGSTLVYDGHGKGLRIVSADGVEQRQLTHPTGEPEWIGVEVRSALTGATRLRLAIKGQPVAVALTPTRVAVLVRQSKSKRIEVYSLGGTLQRSVAVPHSTAEELNADGRWAVYYTGKTIRALDLSNGPTSILTVAKTTPIGLSLEGRRLAWAESTKPSRIRALTLPR